ncbi:hypothetical protein I7I48_02231 [Histoplasma ohiense]|nr:hypothetical protein I7I48_02231 [Histoplasma ohiense (nom. inval.)]
MIPEKPPDPSIIGYIPPQSDNQGCTSTPRALETPLALTWRDIRTLSSVLYQLPKLFTPLTSKDPTDELSLNPRNIWYLCGLATVTALETLLCGLVLIAVTFLPGWLSMGVLMGAVGLIWGLCVPIRGPMVVESCAGLKEDCGNVRKGERWIFVNGVMVGNQGLRNNCDRLSKTFGRPITGIHNPTYGLLWDLLECLFQRSFAYDTYSTRYTYDYLKRSLTDPTVHKVVLIAHSQGGIIVSMALDLLFTDLSAENMAKLEVYTFGSAASHFNNPMRAIQTVTTPISTSPLPQNRSSKGVIRHIEHYVNGEDIVPQWGVLYNVRLTKTRYSGKVFIRKGATGHMFNQHYLNNMFPLDTTPQLRHGSNRPDAPNDFLDQAVRVDERTCRDREAFYYAAAAASAVESPVCCESSAPVSRNGGGSEVSDGVMSVSNGSGICVDEPDEDDEGGVKRYRDGMTVRELSRLWKYLGGADPDMDGRQPLMN